MESITINQEKIKKITTGAQITKLIVFSSLLVLNYYLITLVVNALPATEKIPAIFIILAIVLIFEINLDTLDKRKLVEAMQKNLQNEEYSALNHQLFQAVAGLDCNAFALIANTQINFMYLCSYEKILTIIFNPKIFSELSYEEIKNALAYKISYFTNKHYLERKLFRFLVKMLAINIIAITTLRIAANPVFSFTLLIYLVCNVGALALVLVIGYHLLQEAQRRLDETAAIQATKNPRAFISMIKKATWAEYYKSPNEPLCEETIEKIVSTDLILKNQIKRIEKIFLS